MNSSRGCGPTPSSTRRTFASTSRAEAGVGREGPGSGAVPHQRAGPRLHAQPRRHMGSAVIELAVVGNLDQHHEARLAFDQRCHVAVPGPSDEVAFPMTGYSPISVLAIERSEHRILSPRDISSRSPRLRALGARRRSAGRIPPVGEITENTEDDARSNNRPIDFIDYPACHRSQISAR